MELIRFDSAKAAPLPGGANATYVPIHSGDRMTAMILQLDKKGDTGKREVGTDIVLTVISGEGRLRSGGEIADLQPGDVCVLPGGILHHIWTTDSRLQAVMITLGSSGV
ncbi:MAG: cupin domain-containing protein [Anaerolineae bacterium]|nr:cupin domain-containing protein [Anaerolineae bacterium]